MDKGTEPLALRVATRYHYLDGLRGTAALLVVVHHGVTLLDFAIYSGSVSDSHFTWDVWLSGMPFVLVNSGSFAVCIFLALSGFVLGHSFLTTDLSLLPLIVKRYVRLTVPIAAANMMAFIVLATFTLAPLPGASLPGRSLPAILHALGYCLNEALVRATITGIAGPTYNGVLWTMFIEFWGSICLIVAFVLARRITEVRRARLIAALCILTIGAVLTWNSYLVLMIVDAILSLLLRGGQARPSNLTEWRIFILVALALLLGTLPLGRAHPTFYDPLLFLFGGTFESMAVRGVLHPLLNGLGLPAWVFAPIGPYVIWHGVAAIVLVAAVCRSSACQHALSRPAFQWLGRISFPLYLIHAVLRDTWAAWLLRQALRHGLSYGPAVCFALAFYVVLALAVATVFAAVVERPAMIWAARAAQWLDGQIIDGRGRFLLGNPR